jgi:hypothetical protein
MGARGMTMTDAIQLSAQLAGRSKWKPLLSIILNCIILFIAIPLMIVFIFSLLIQCREASAADRCRDFLPDVRSAHIRYLGLSYPWWYGVGQLKQESACRADVTAFDAGQGIAQFMPATAREVNRLMGANLNPYNPEHATRMQAFYMARLNRSRPDPGPGLWALYQAYNGGWPALRGEEMRAGAWSRTSMRTECFRKKIVLRSGALLDLCEVNYDYSVRVHRYGQTYRISADGRRFFDEKM